jgi:hypothetical protein
LEGCVTGNLYQAQLHPSGCHDSTVRQDSIRQQTKQSPLQYGLGDGRDPEEAGLLHLHEMLAVAHAHCFVIDELAGAGIAIELAGTEISWREAAAMPGSDRIDEP